MFYDIQQKYVIKRAHVQRKISVVQIGVNELLKPRPITA